MAPALQVTARKAAIIARTPELLASLGPPEAVAIDEGETPEATTTARAVSAPLERTALATSCHCLSWAASQKPTARASAFRPPFGLGAGAGEVRSGAYCLLPADLRDLGSVEAALEAAGFDFTAPTFVLSGANWTG